MREAGSPLGYHPNSKKCWLVVKPQKEGRAKDLFAETGINITTEVHKHLGAALGSQPYFEYYVGGKVADSVKEVTNWPSFQDLSHKLVLQHSHLGLDIVGVLYENTAGYQEPTAAFRAYNLGSACTITHRTQVLSSRAQSSNITGAYGRSWAHKSIF